MNSPEFGPPILPIPVQDMDTARVSRAIAELLQRVNAGPVWSADYLTRVAVERVLYTLGYGEDAIERLTRPDSN